jgi:maltodextrin utilization protein YvdJ
MKYHYGVTKSSVMGMFIFCVSMVLMFGSCLFVLYLSASYMRTALMSNQDAVAVLWACCTLLCLAMTYFCGLFMVVMFKEVYRDLPPVLKGSWQ